MHLPIVGEPYRVIAYHRPTLLTHLLDLNDDDRYGRFATSLSNAEITSYVNRIDLERDIGLAVASADERIIGFIHLAVHGDAAELGASVSAPWRRQGVAQQLFKAAVKSARSAGIREIHLATAHPVARHILTRLGYPCRMQMTYPRGVVPLQDTAA